MKVYNSCFYVSVNDVCSQNENIRKGQKYLDRRRDVVNVLLSS